MRSIPRTLGVAGPAVAGLVLLAGCGGGDDETDDTTSSSEPDLIVETVENELAFTEDLYSASAGEIVVDYVAADGVTHTLVIEEHEDDMRLQIGAGTERDRGTIALDAGEYTLYCDIGGHRDGGMEATLEVS